MMIAVVDRQRPTGPALQEGDAVGANDVDDERLRQQRFDEPAGLERGAALAGSQQLKRYSIIKYVV